MIDAVLNASGQEFEYYIEAADEVPMVFIRRGDRWRCVAALGHAGHVLPANLTKATNATSAQWRLRVPGLSALLNSFHSIRGEVTKQDILMM